MLTSTSNFESLCRDYLVALRNARSDPQATPELSLRPALDSFLKDAAQLSGRDINFVSEGKKLIEGRPDFVLTAKVCLLVTLRLKNMNLI